MPSWFFVISYVMTMMFICATLMVNAYNIKDTNNRLDAIEIRMENKK